jgi:hypothetical protein
MGEKKNNQIGHILVDRRRLPNVLHVRSFTTADCDSSHYLVVAKVREILAVNKQFYLCRVQTKITEISYGEVQSQEVKRVRGYIAISC